MMNHDSGNDISRDDYYQGYGLLCLDLTPDGCSASESGVEAESFDLRDS